MDGKKLILPIVGVVVVLATILFVIQLVTEGGLNLALYALAFAIPATGNIMIARKTKNKKDIGGAVIDSVIVVVLAVLHICL